MKEWKLDYPAFNLRYKWNQCEINLMMAELPFALREFADDGQLAHALNLLPDKEKEKYEKERQRKFLEHCCKHMSRLEVFGHVEFMKGFVQPGELTTRYEISLGIMSIVYKYLSEQAQRPVPVRGGDYTIFIMPFFDIIVMPDVDFEKEIKAKMDQRKYDPSKHETYIKWLYTHLPPNIQFVFDIKEISPIPKFKLVKPFLRVIRRVGYTNKDPDLDYVFVDDVKLVISRLETDPKLTDKHGKPRHQFHYFPFKYLDYALGLYGFNRDQIEIVPIAVGQREPNNYCCTQGPSGENVVPAENCFFRLLKDLGKYNPRTEGNEMMDIFNSYEIVLANNHILPYMCRYYSSDKLNQASYPASMREYQARRRPSKFSIRTKTALVKPKPQIKPEDLVSWDDVKLDNLPLEALTKVPGEIKGFVVKFMARNNQYALLLHEQGFCIPGKFCYAAHMKVEEVGLKCEENEELMKKRIKTAMTKDPRSPEIWNAFIAQNREYKTNFYIPPPTVTEKQSKKIEASTKYFNSKTSDMEPSTLSMFDGEDDELIVGKSSEEEDKKSDCSCSTTSENTTTTSSMSACYSDVHPDGTETSKLEDDDKQSQIEEPVSRDDRAQYEKMIKTIEQENDQNVAKLNKRIAAGQKKNEEDRATIEKQRQEIKELKKKLEMAANEKKEMQTGLEGDIKRISAEKLKLEENFESFKTQKALDDPCSRMAEYKKIMERMSGETMEQKNIVKSKDQTIKVIQQALDNAHRENEKLREDNESLKNSITTNEQVVNLRLANKDLENKLKLSEAECAHKEEKLRLVSKSLQKSEAFHYSLKNRAMKLEDVQKKNENLQEMFMILESYATPSVRAAVNRIEQLSKLLDDSKNDEANFNHAFKKLQAYEAVEDATNYQLVLDAHKEYDTARAAKIVYESDLVASIEEIKENPPQYFMMENCFTNPKKISPFSPKTMKRMSELRELIDAKMRDEVMLNHHHHHNHNNRHTHKHK